MNRTNLWRMMVSVLGVALPLAAAAQTPSAPVPAAGRKIVLAAEQAVGGHLVTFADGVTKGVCIDSTCTDSSTHFEWKLPAPLPPGWRRGVVHFGPREGDDKGYVNLCLGIVNPTPQKPSVSVMTNFARYNDKDKGPQQFEFWLYSFLPMESIRIEHIYSQLWRYKRTWPVTQVTLEDVQAPVLTADDVVTLELPVEPDGAVALPAPLFAGMWSIRFNAKTEGAVVGLGADGRAVAMPFKAGWNGREYTGGVSFHMQSPLQKITVKAAPPVKAFSLQNLITRVSSPTLPAEPPLMVTVDATRTETAQLEMIGSRLAGDAPVFPLLPMGKKTAVLTTWDDGTEWDLRMAEISNRLGIYPTFFLNKNSAVMKSLDKLEALGAEIGSHCYNHCFLFQIPPQQAYDECAAMRQLLEARLGHPVISFSYPNGYSAAYDAEGDYVLRAVRNAGYWSGRTTSPGSEIVDSIAEPMAFKTAGFFGEDKRGVEGEWKAVRAKEGGIFHMWGHAHQLGKTDEQWKKVEEYLARYANLPDVWYPTQGELFTWIWLRKNVQLTVTDKSPNKVIVKVTRPWLHPYLSGKRPLSLKVPAGVDKVLWQGREIAVAGGFVELPWAERP